MALLTRVRRRHGQIDPFAPPVPPRDLREHAPPERRKILHFAKTAACANAGARADRDYDWASTMGAPWEAIQNARKIMAAGGDSPSELQKAMKYGVLTPTAGLPAEQQPPASVTSSPGFDDWWRQLQAQRFAGS
jgi:hypothetical protein